jgi:hypothetical protein
MLGRASQCDRDRELGHFGATCRVVMHKAVPFVRETSTASEPVGDAYGLEVFLMFRMFEVGIELVRDEIGMKGVFISGTWADKHCMPSIWTCDVDRSVGL